MQELLDDLMEEGKGSNFPSLSFFSLPSPSLIRRSVSVKRIVDQNTPRLMLSLGGILHPMLLSENIEKSFRCWVVLWMLFGTI